MLARMPGKKAGKKTPKRSAKAENNKQTRNASIYETRVKISLKNIVRLIFVRTAVYKIK